VGICIVWFSTYSTSGGNVTYGSTECNFYVRTHAFESCVDVISAILVRSMLCVRNKELTAQICISELCQHMVLHILAWLRGICYFRAAWYSVCGELWVLKEWRSFWWGDSILYAYFVCRYWSVLLNKPREILLPICGGLTTGPDLEKLIIVILNFLQ
jgi:hypothetical protein